MLKRIRITGWPRIPPSNPSLAPFYARARRRVWRRLRRPLLIGGLLLVVVAAALVVGMYLI